MRVSAVKEGTETDGGVSVSEPLQRHASASRDCGRREKLLREATSYNGRKTEGSKLEIDKVASLLGHP